MHGTIEYNNCRDLGTDSEDTSQGPAGETSNMAQPGKILDFGRTKGNGPPFFVGDKWPYNCARNPLPLTDLISLSKLSPEWHEKSKQLFPYLMQVF